MLLLTISDVMPSSTHDDFDAVLEAASLLLTGPVRFAHRLTMSYWQRAD